jgi:cytochrome oxidase assembly protein ShyY1
MWDFARRPRWILSHLLVVALIVTMVNLGLWQLRRYDEKKVLNDDIRSRGSLPTEPIGALVPTASTRASTRGVVWRQVSATGTYRSGDELVVSNRSIDGQPGFWVLTPLEQADGTLVAVVRGFVFRAEFDERALTSVPAPTGMVTIEGALQSSPTSGRFGEERSQGGFVPAVSQVDTDELADRWGAPVLPVWLRLERGPGAPTPAGPLVPVRPPPLSKGPHLSYAVQWFIFTIIALIGYPMILRRQATGRDRSVADWPDDTPPPGVSSGVASADGDIEDPAKTPAGEPSARQNGLSRGTIV